MLDIVLRFSLLLYLIFSVVKLSFLSFQSFLVSLDLIFVILKLILLVGNQTADATQLTF